MALVRYLDPVHVASVSVSSLKLSHFDLEGLVFFESSNPLGLTFYQLPLQWGNLSSEGRDLMEISHLRVRVLKSSLNNAWLWGSLYLFSSTVGGIISAEG